MLFNVIEYVLKSLPTPAHLTKGSMPSYTASTHFESCYSENLLVYFTKLILPGSECWVKIRAKGFRMAVTILKQFMVQCSEMGHELQKLL